MLSTNQAKAILGEVYSACGSIFQSKLCDAYLYGSYARGDYSEGSDVDILITVDMEGPQLKRYRREVASLTSDLSLKHDVTVSVTVKPQEQFLRYADILPYYSNVLREGIRYAI